MPKLSSRWENLRAAVGAFFPVVQYKKSRKVFVVFGLVALAASVALLLWDAFPGLFPARAHDFLGAFPLAIIALVYLISHLYKSPTRGELIKAVLLALAFLFWAASLVLSNSPLATLFGDLAIGLFVLDIFFVIFGWPTKLLE